MEPEPGLKKRVCFNLKRCPAFLWQTRVQGVGHLAVPCSEKASSQLLAGCSAAAGEGNPARCVYPAPRGHLGQREAPGICCLSGGGEPRKSTRSLRFLLSGWELDGGCWCAGLEADQSDPPSSSSGLFVRRLFFLAWHWISSPFSLLPGRPPPLAGMGWRPRRGLRES